MSAHDYKICPACFNVFLAKVSKRNTNLMLDDRRIITDTEIFGIIKWKLRQFCVENKTDTCISISTIKPLLRLRQLAICLKKSIKNWRKKNERRNIKRRCK